MKAKKARTGGESRYQGILGQYFKVLEEEIIADNFSFLGHRVLDLGGGTGRLIPLFSSENQKLIIMDISIGDLMLAKAKANGKENITVVCGNGSMIPLKDRSLSGVIALGTFQQIHDLSSVLSELERVCQKGAPFIFSCWNKNQWLNVPYLSLGKECARYSVKGVRKSLKVHGFEILSCKSAFFMPRRLFWGIYKLLSIRLIKDGWVLLSLAIECFLMKFSFLKERGNELMLVARLCR